MEHDNVTTFDAIFFSTKDEHKVSTNTRQLFKHKVFTCHLRNYNRWQKRKSNSETYASESDALPPLQNCIEFFELLSHLTLTKRKWKKVKC